MKKIKQTVAIICVVLLAGLYITTFILAMTDSTATMTYFKGCVACTIFVPLAAWAFIALHKLAMTRSKRKDYYSPSSGGDTSSSDDKQQLQ